MPASSPSHRYDILIAGNGVMGTSLAYALARADRTLKIAVIGPASRDGAATLAAGAMINVWAEMVPGQFDDPALAERADLMLRALPLWDPLCAELRAFTKRSLEPRWGTCLFTNARSGPQESRALESIVLAMSARGLSGPAPAPSDLAWLRPVHGAEIERAIRLPDGWIDPVALLGAYDDALRILGVDLIDERVRTLTLSKHRRCFVLGDGEELDAKHLVLANGSFAQALIDPLPELRRAVPRLLFGVGTALDVQAGPDPVDSPGLVFRTTDRGGGGSLHLVPTGHGSFYFGASSRVCLTADRTAVPQSAARLAHDLTAEFHSGFAGASMTARPPGFRPTTADTFPLLGECDSPGVWFANGMKRDGLTSSPFVARELARALLGQTCALPRRFRPSRPLISFKSRAQAIADTIGAATARAERFGTAEGSFADHRIDRQGCEEVYERRSLGQFGIPPEIFPLYADDEAFAAIDHRRADPA